MFCEFRNVIGEKLKSTGGAKYVIKINYPREKLCRAFKNSQYQSKNYVYVSLKKMAKRSFC